MQLAPKTYDRRLPKTLWMNSLQILQYNVQKSKDKVMSPLLADSRIASYDLIALQEPWQNPHCNRTYCPSALGFMPAYDNRQRRSCFLINRRLDPTVWSVEYPSPDLTVLCLQVEDRTVWIYNIYSPPLGSYTTDHYDTSLTLLPDLLSRDGDHLLLGDFNLHHPL